MSTRALRKLVRKLGISVHWLETGEPDSAVQLARLVLDHQDARSHVRQRHSLVSMSIC